MLFTTMLDIIPGKAEETIALAKSIKPPEGVVIREFLQLFGKPDFVIIYEAPSENKATEFVLKFTSYATPRTSLCSKIERKD
jgi:uncharacterized protein with GYD domain